MTVELSTARGALNQFRDADLFSRDHLHRRRTQKSSDDSIKLIRGVNVDPMTGAGDRCEFGVWKVPADQRSVLFHEKIRAPAADKASGLGERIFAGDGFGQLIVIFDNGVERDAPTKSLVRVADQVFQKKLSDRLIRNRCREGSVDLAKGLVRQQWETAESRQQLPVHRRVTFRRNVDDDELVDLFWIL